jgi:curli biogenesis system outer membrane secretion channel CsgG
MKQVLAIALFAVAPCVAGCATASSDGGASRAGDTVSARPRAHGPKKRVAIVDFAGGGWSVGGVPVSDAARDACTEALVKSGAFVVVEREQLDQLLKEQGLVTDAIVNPKTAAQFGRVLGLQAIITGKVTDYAEENKRGGYGGFSSESRTARARVSLRVTDANTGEVWLAESGEGSADERTSVNVFGQGGGGSRNDNLGKAALYAAVHQVMERLIARADDKPWEGTVARAGADGRVYITAGRDIGLVVGTRLDVRRPGEAISDPTTGQVIGRELGKSIGTLTLAGHVNEKLSVCDAPAGGALQPGDIVTVASVTP